MPTYLRSIVPEIAQNRPRAIALIDRSRSITYSELDKEIKDAAARLINNGMKKSERVGMISRNSIGFVSMFFAISHAGCVPVPLNYSLKPLEIAKQADDCSVSALYFGKGMDATAKEVRKEVRSVRFVIGDTGGESIIASGSEANPRYKRGSPKNNLKPSDLAAIMYTSGTIASPLGVMLSHRNLISNGSSVIKYLRLTPSDKVCCVLPLNYIYGLSILLSHLMAGSTVIFDNKFAYPNLILDAIDKFKATTFAGVSSHYALLLNSSDIISRRLPSLKRFLQAGDRMPEAITEKLLGLFPRKKLYLMYGQTEASPRLTYLDPKLALKKPASVGKAIPGVEVKVLSKKGKECRAGEEGEITASGPNVMLGYWGSKTRTKGAIKDAWLYTGDAGYKDADGDLFITGRKKDFVKIGGNRVSLRDIEDTVRRHAGVAEAVAIDVNDNVLGRRIKLFVVPARGVKISERDLIKFCKSRMPYYKSPVKIVILKSLPINSLGKVDKKVLEG